MKKNDLIKLLASIDGNPEVMLWNGLVGDVTHIEQNVTCTQLTKMSEKYFLRTVENEYRLDNKPITEESIKHSLKCYRKNYKFEFDQFVTQEDIDSKKYLKRNVVVIQPKLTGKTFFDRIGKVKY